MSWGPELSTIMNIKLETGLAYNVFYKNTNIPRRDNGTISYSYFIDLLDLIASFIYTEGMYVLSKVNEGRGWKIIMEYEECIRR